MDVHGAYTFNAPRERVWDLLMDPAVVSSCVPGCGPLEPRGDDCYAATITVAVAAITGSYQGTVTIADKVPVSEFRLIVDGQGRMGFVRGNSHIALRDDGPSTAVEVSANVEVGGAIARVGQRLLGSVAKLMLDRFFSCLQAKAVTVPAASAEEGYRSGSSVRAASDSTGE